MIDVIVGGSSAQALAVKVGRLLGVPTILPEFKKFPDGEKYVRIPEDVSGKRVALIQSFYHTPDEFLMEYFILVDTLKDLGAKKVTGIIPYLAYARQDERFKPGEAVSFKIVTRLIEAVGTDEIYTIDTHLHRVGELEKMFNIPSHNLTAVPLLAEYIREHYKLENPIVIGPDEEAEQWAKVAAEKLDTDYDVLIKKRFSATEVKVQPRGELNLEGRDVIIVDDIISTGGTIIEATKVVRSFGARNVLVACTHPILSNYALSRLYGIKLLDVIGTDTVLSPISVVSVAPVIADALRK